MMNLEAMAGEGGGESEETDELGAHLAVMLGKKATPAQKSAFKAAVQACMDDYGAEEEPAIIE